MVPGEGVEPSLPKKPDFESGASANSATQASFNNANWKDSVGIETNSQV